MAGIEALAVALAVLLGTGFLHVFYRAVEAHWPASYFSITTGPTYAISANPVGYLLFRFAPTFVVCAFVAVVLGRNDQPAVLPVIMISVLHAATTTGRALVNLVRAGRLRTRPLIALMYIGVSLGLLVVGALALPASTVFAPVVPTLNETLSDLWTALLAGVVAAYIVRVTQQGHLSTEELLEQSRRRISPELWEEAVRQAVQYKADPDLVRAVMLVENLQRPSWFRKLEALAGAFRARGSYGIMQVQSSERLSDLESIQTAVSTEFADVEIPKRDYGWGPVPDSSAVKEFAVSYNPSDDFADLVTAAYLWLL